MNACKRWCFTLNNFTQDECTRIITYINSSEVQFGVVGKEVGENGTPHLQGYVRLQKKVRLTGIKKIIGSRSHLESAMGTDDDNDKYCTKDGDVLVTKGKPRSATTSSGGYDHLGERLPDLMDYVRRGKGIRELAGDNPNDAGLLLHYGKNISYHIQIEKNMEAMENLEKKYAKTEWKEWQTFIIDWATKEAIHDREVMWITDIDGGQGKTFLSKYLITQGAIRFENGKSADIKYAYQGQETVIFDYSRSCMDRVNYEVIESIKNGVMFSPKFESTMKIFNIPRVIIFANFNPDESKLSRDRWWIVQI